MLSAIRNKSKGWVAYLIVGLITVPFALFGIQDYVSRSANNSIATVDGEDIDIKKHGFKVEIKSPTFHEMEIVEGMDVKMKYLLDL